MVKLKGDALLKYWRDNGFIVPVNHYRDLERRYYQGNDANMTRHDGYVRKALKRMISDGLGLEEVGVKVEPKSGSGEFDVVGVCKSAVVCCEAKCNGTGNSRKQLEHFRRLFPNMPVGTYQYIGSTDQLEKIHLSF